MRHVHRLHHQRSRGDEPDAGRAAKADGISGRAAEQTTQSHQQNQAQLLCA